MSNFEHPGGFRSMNEYPDIAKYLNGTVPYTSVAQCNSLILIGIRSIGLTVNINNVEYHYKENLANEGLVLKVSDFVIESLDLKLDKTDYNDRFKGVYLTLASLKSTHPTGVAGEYAQVNESGATEVLNYNWDVEKADWVANAVQGFSANNTDELPEGSSNLYYTSTRVLATILSGFSLLTGSLASSDTILSAFGKIQNQINNIIIALGYKAPLQAIDDPTTAGVSNVGKTRYYVSGNASFVDMVMQTGEGTYAWTNIVSNTW
jgi:hypothetical protein